METSHIEQPTNPTPTTQLSTATTECQLCGEELTAHDAIRHDTVKRHEPYCERDGRILSARVTHFCGVKCPAILCLGCVQKHVTDSLDTVVPSKLPKVCCPVCLKAVNKARWELLSTQPVVDKYEWLCHMACMVRWCGGCAAHECHTDRQTSSSLLPYFPGEGEGENEPMRGWPAHEPPTSVWLAPEANRKMPALRALCRQFCNHRATALQVIASIEDITSEDSERLREPLYYQVLKRVQDEERRAALVLTYYSKYFRIRASPYESLHPCFRCKHWVYRSLGDYAANNGTLSQWQETLYDDKDALHPDATTCNETNVVEPVVECPFQHNSDVFWCPCGAL